MFRFKLKKTWTLRAYNYNACNELVNILKELHFDNREDLTPVNNSYICKNGIYDVIFSNQDGLYFVDVRIRTMALFRWCIKMALLAREDLDVRFNKA